MSFSFRVYSYDFIVHKYAHILYHIAISNAVINDITNITNL